MGLCGCECREVWSCEDAERSVQRSNGASERQALGR